jgi:hypothetical protein
MKGFQHGGGSISKHFIPPLGLSYTAEKRTTFAKAYGIKVRYYLGTHWKQKEK